MSGCENDILRRPTPSFCCGCSSTFLRFRRNLVFWNQALPSKHFSGLEKKLTSVLAHTVASIASVGFIPREFKMVIVAMKLALIVLSVLSTLLPSATATPVPFTESDVERMRLEGRSEVGGLIHRLQNISPYILYTAPAVLSCDLSTRASRPSFTVETTVQPFPLTEPSPSFAPAHAH